MSGKLLYAGMWNSDYEIEWFEGSYFSGMFQVPRPQFENPPAFLFRHLCADDDIEVLFAFLLAGGCRYMSMVLNFHKSPESGEMDLSTWLFDR